MVKRRFLKVFINTLLIIIGLTFIFISNGYFEKIIIDKQIKDFKERAIYEGVDPLYNNIHYYKVEKKYEYEDISRYTFDPLTSRKIGSKTDVIITNRNPMRGVAVLDPIVGYLSTNFYVGHASMNSVDDGSRMFEVIGNSSDQSRNAVIEGTNDWYIYYNDLETPIIVGLRIKETTEEQRDKMVEYANMHLGKGYNYTFLFNRSNTFYCTDLVSRAAKYAGLHINYDHLATTGNDMIISKNTYIYFLRDIVYEDGQPIFNIYYLEDYE